MGWIDRLPGVRGLILDMDGVLWKDSAPIGDLPVIFEHIRARGLKVTLATNNATRSVEQYLEKLHGFGVSLQPEQIISSAMAAGAYLLERYPAGSCLFIVGEESLKTYVRGLGYTVLEHADDVMPRFGEIVTVLSAMDRSLNYEKLRLAGLLIRAGVPFIGTNPDKTFPTPHGLVPGAGSILALLEAATSVSPVIMGKPATMLFELAMRRMGLAGTETLAVGDRMDTDIRGGQAAGCLTAAVLSGVTDRPEAECWQPAPTIIAPDLASLVD